MILKINVDRLNFKFYDFEFKIAATVKFWMQNDNIIVPNIEEFI